MYLMGEVADELMRRNRSGDSTWAEMDIMEDGNLGFATFRASPPDLSAPTFPRTGDLIVVELCSWDCDKAMEMLRHEQALDEQAAVISMGQTLEQDLGRIMLRAIRGAQDGTVRLVVPVGTEEVHVQMSLQPLNAHVSPDDPSVLNLLGQLSKAVEKVRNCHRRYPLRREAESRIPKPESTEGHRWTA